MTPSTRRLAARLLALWLLLSPSGLVFANLQPGNLSLTSTGDTAVVGSALAAGNTLSLHSGGNLSLLASQTQSQQQLSDISKGKKKATTLTYSDHEIRQILTTLTAGDGLNINVGGDFRADIGAKNAEDELQADRMTVNGVVRGDAKQQVSVTRTGATNADANTSEVRGNLSAQGIRSGANEAFNPITAQSGQAAITQYLQSGLVQIKNNPQLTQQLNAILKDTQGAQLTYQDDSGKLTLTVAGQAKVQEVYNHLIVQANATLSDTRGSMSCMSTIAE